jgi:UDP-glucuronate 4-epimerase
LRRGDRVVSIDNFNDYYAPECKRRNAAEVAATANSLERAENFLSFEGDIRDLPFLERVFSVQKPTAVIHLAAYAGVQSSIEKPVLYTDVNINGTVNLLECMKKAQVKRHMFASSSSVYGNNKKLPFCESDAVDFPISPYAATKKAGELLCHTYHHLYAINTACLRFFTVYGPRQRPDLAIHKFARLIMEDRPIVLYGDGSTKRDYTFIADIVDGILQALEWTNSNENRYEIFNLGESNTISLIEMVKTIESVIGKNAQIVWNAMQPGDVNCTYADISKAKRILGYAPHTRFEDGIEAFIGWLTKKDN